MQFAKYKRIKKSMHLNPKVFIAFLMFELLFTVITGPLMVFYGPFSNLKKTVVGASMSSFKHQYIAKLFLSDQQIAKILQGNQDNHDKLDNLDKKEIESPSNNDNLNDISLTERNNKIEYLKIEGRKFDGYLLVIHDPTRVRVGVTQKLGIQGEKTSQIAAEYNAVAAINGGGFTDMSQNSTAKWTGTGAFPEGIVIRDGKVVYPTETIQSDDKVLGSVVGITYNGLLVVGQYTLSNLVKKNIRDALTFGPPLVIKGIRLSKDTYGREINNQGTAPRTAIGQRIDGAILFLVIDGRQALKVGATIRDIQNILIQQKAYNAINLDGGASSTMFYNGKVINSPSDKFGERPIPSIFYVE